MCIHHTSGRSGEKLKGLEDLSKSMVQLYHFLIYQSMCRGRGTCSKSLNLHSYILTLDSGATLLLLGGFMYLFIVKHQYPLYLLPLRIYMKSLEINLECSKIQTQTTILVFKYFSLFFKICFVHIIFPLQLLQLLPYSPNFLLFNLILK